MRNRTLITLSLPALLFVACAKKAPEPEPAVAAAKVNDAAQQAKLEEQKAVAELTENLKRVHFLFDSDQMTEESKTALAANAQILVAHPQLVIEVQGHCDDRGTTEYNLALGQRRAEAVQKYLARAGVPTPQLRTLSLGEERPLESGNGESIWAENRRAEFRVLTGEGVAENDKIVGSTDK